MLYECKDCLETFYTPEMFDKCCPKCKGTNYQKPQLSTNWGAVHGTALHQIMENYALAVRGTHNDSSQLTPEETSKFLDWKTALKEAYKRGTKNGQSKEDFAIYDIAKPKDVESESGWCDSCVFGEDAPCEITGESLSEMKKHGCVGCPKSLYVKSLKTVSKYIERYDQVLKNRKILGIEFPFNLVLGKDINGNDVITTGFIDLVTELDSDTIEVIDHKFGSWVPGFDEFSEDIQARLYALISRTLFPQYKEYIINENKFN
jgi:hypothetical protein